MMGDRPVFPPAGCLTVPDRCQIPWLAPSACCLWHWYQPAGSRLQTERWLSSDAAPNPPVAGGSLSPKERHENVHMRYRIIHERLGLMILKTCHVK